MLRASLGLAQNGTFNNPTFTGLRTGVAYPLAQSFAAVSAPADTSEDVLATVTIPANTLRANDGIRVYSLWSCTNNANNKTIRVRLGGLLGTAYMGVGLANQLSSSNLVAIFNRNATNSQVGNYSGSNGGLGFAGGVLTTSSVDMTADTTLVLTGQKATAGDTLTLEGYCVEVLRL